MTVRRTDPEPRFLAKVQFGPECWEWQGATIKGYGDMKLGGRSTRAHHVAYRLYVGPIPDGLQIDHLCNNPLCVRPDHLEPVTQAENNRRKAERQTHCKRGHSRRDSAVLGRRADGRSYCRPCEAARMREVRSAKACSVG